MSSQDVIGPAIESAAEELSRVARRFEVFARAGRAHCLRRTAAGAWEQRQTREMGVACRVVIRGSVGFAASSGGSARTGREVARTAATSLAPGIDPLPPPEALGLAPCPVVPAAAEPAAIESFAHTLERAVTAQSGDVALLDLRVFVADSETMLLTAESFFARVHCAGAAVELLLAAQDGPARLVHFAARSLGELDPESVCERAVETVALVARGSSPRGGPVDVIAAPAVAAELVGALARDMVSCRLAGQHHLRRAHVSPVWRLVDARGGPGGLLPTAIDAEGLPARVVPLLAGGRQHDPPLTWALARALGAPSGGAVRPSYRTPPMSGPANLVVGCEQPVCAVELLERLGDGLYLALPAGQVRVDQQRGRFAMPCAAVSIVGGKPKVACPHVEIRSSFRRLLGALEAGGTECASFGLTSAVTTPSLLLRGLGLV